MAKKGRPRKAGSRTKSGRLSRSLAATRDNGTAEAIAKRCILVNGADPALAATVPGILLARGYLSRDQHDAAQRYAGLHRTAFGPAWRQVCPLAEAHGGPTIPDDRLIRLREALDQLHARMTLEQRQAVADVAVYNWIPQWFYTARLGLRELAEDVAEREALISGLDALVSN